MAPHVDFDEPLIRRAREIIAKEAPENIRLEELSLLVATRIAERGREIQGEPSMAAVLEERIQLVGLTTKQKLEQTLDVMAFFEYFANLLKGIPSPMPDAVRKAADMTPETYEFLAPSRRNLN